MEQKRIQMTRDSSSWLPQVVNLTEISGSLLAQIEQSGVGEEDLDVSINQNSLIISNGKLKLRIQFCVIDLPPLQERSEDIDLLAQYFVDKLCRQYALPPKQLTPEFLQTLARYPWPGNVRELSNVLEQAICTAQLETTLFPKHLPVHVRIQAVRANWHQRHASNFAVSSPSSSYLPKLQDLREDVFSRAERQYLHNLLTLTGRNIGQACELSGLSRSRLYTLLKKHQITCH